MSPSLKSFSCYETRFISYALDVKERRNKKMVILSGILSLVFMCFSIVILSSFPVSMHKNNGYKNKIEDSNDRFNYLFDVYRD